MENLEPAVIRGVQFLRRRQLPNGEFTTLLGANRSMSDPVFDSSPFVTSFVVYSLTQLDGRPAADIVAKAASFLASQMEFGGVWRYWSSRQHKHRRLPPDLDDTACISFALASAGYARPRNRWAFRGNRDASDRFKTWLFPSLASGFRPWFSMALAIGVCQALVRNARVPTPADEDVRFRVMHIERDDVDPIVNANAVLYLGENADTLAAIDYVIESMRDSAAAKSLYYEDPLAWCYIVARAFRHASPRLSLLRGRVVELVEARANELHLPNALQAALAACALQIYDPESARSDSLLEAIRSTQREDGGWHAYAFYNVWGSEELTTALCIEALARSRERAERASFAMEISGKERDMSEEIDDTDATASSQPSPDSDILENADDPATEDPADPANTEVR